MKMQFPILNCVRLDQNVSDRFGFKSSEHFKHGSWEYKKRISFGKTIVFTLTNGISFFIAIRQVGCHVVKSH